jgi:perosamine synthetase
LGLTDGDIVLPAYTCTVMADAVVASGNRPVFVDIDLADYNMRLDAMKAAITPQTRAVIATHMYGYPTDVNAIREAVGDRKVLIIEDRALGLLIFPPGTTDLQSDLSLFSFGPAKHLFTVQGGIIATNSADLYGKIQAYRDREMADLPMALWMKRWARLLFSYMPFMKSMLNRLRKGIQNGTTPDPGSNDSNSMPTLVEPDYATAYADFQARVGLSQLHKLEVILERRKEMAEFYTRELRDIPGLTPAPIVPGANYSHYTVRVQRRDEIGFSQQMQDKGIEVGQVYDHVLPFRERFRPYAKDSYPNTEQATREVVNLPIHPTLKLLETKYIVGCVRHILKRLDA